MTRSRFIWAASLPTGSAATASCVVRKVPRLQLFCAIGHLAPTQSHGYARLGEEAGRTDLARSHGNTVAKRASLGPRTAMAPAPTGHNNRQQVRRSGRDVPEADVDRVR